MLGLTAWRVRRQIRQEERNGQHPRQGQWVIRDEVMNRGGRKGSLGRIVERCGIKDGDTVGIKAYTDQLCEIDTTSEHFRWVYRCRRQE